MADFEIAYKITARIEAGFQKNPDDNGNWTGGQKGVGNLVGTNWGITAPQLAAYLKRTPTVSDMKNLKKETAKIIFKINYWNPINGDQIPDQDIANAMFDMAVNAGTGTSKIIAGRAMEGLTENPLKPNTEV
jgi:lysozyme family protein